MEFWEILLIIVGPIISIWYYLRRANGIFDGGEINERDQVYYEDCEQYGAEIAGFKENFRDAKKIFKK